MCKVGLNAGTQKNLVGDFLRKNVSILCLCLLLHL